MSEHTSAAAQPIVVGVDGSASSLRALQQAAELADALHLPLEAVTTWEYSVRYDPYYAAWSPDAESRPQVGCEVGQLERGGAQIANSIVSGTPSVIHGNVPNAGALITNLPADACVEVPSLVDARGVQPTAIGDLPPQLAALNRTNINVQTLAVRAALEGNVENVHHAVALDPLTAALLTLEDARAMTDELLAAHAQRLPERLRVG